MTTEDFDAIPPAMSPEEAERFERRFNGVIARMTMPDDELFERAEQAAKDVMLRTDDPFGLMHMENAIKACREGRKLCP